MAPGLLFQNKYAGKPVTSRAAPIAERVGFDQITLATTNAAATIKSAGTTGYPSDT